jgi:hypothetical protein
VEETDFNAKYWYKNTQLVTVVNPRSEDFVFQSTVETGVNPSTGRNESETRKYIVKAGSKQRFPGTITNMYLDQMSKLVAQDDNKITNLIDFSVKAKYYDDLTVSVEDLIRGYEPMPEFLEGQVNEVATAKVEEKPFAAAKEEAPKTPAKA